MGDPKKKTEGPAAGQRRVRVSYSPDGFRGVKDVDADIAAVMVQEHRARYVPDDTPVGEDEAPEGEFRGPLNAKADTSSSGNEGSSTAGSTASTSTAASTAGTSGPAAR